MGVLDKMKRYHATKVSEQAIELTSVEELDKLYETIEGEEDFILTWKEGAVKHSKIMIGNNFKSKVRNEDVQLSAKEGGK